MSGLLVFYVGEKVLGGVIFIGLFIVYVGSSVVGLVDWVFVCVLLVGKLVNLMFGSKLLLEEVDFVLVVLDIFIFVCGYLLSNFCIGWFGWGWWLLGESMYLELSEDVCVLVDV